MKTYWIIWLLVISTFSGFSEGTKELRPTSSDYGYVQVNDVGRPFALMSNENPLHRLYIHIENTNEKIYFGFKTHTSYTSGNGKFLIKDPNGNVVYDTTTILISSGAGYIESYVEAVAGPKIGGLPSTGYNPLSYTPLTTGDFYIEFSTTLASKYLFELFDITVVNSSNTPIHGRLWSYAWDLNSNGATNPMNCTFYIYTNDKYVSAVDFNGIEPYGFVISSNSTGTANTGDLVTDRKSVTINSTYPEYKLFLNLPDTTVYEIAEKPSMLEDLRVLGIPMYQENILFYLNMDKAGTIEIFLDLDDNPGYQPLGEDIVLVKQIKSGGDTIVWDGKDGQNNFVQDDVIVSVTSRFATGVTHLPLYDPEYHPNGFIVHRILPDTTQAALYWDDSNFTDGTVEFEGTIADNEGHNFPYISGGYGNTRTMNTWWNGYEIDDLKSFAFTIDGVYLPINLTYWYAINKGNYVYLIWSTESETKNHYFEIQRSTNGKNWEIIATIIGAGNSSKTINYSEIDEHPLQDISYYRLKQIDFNGNYNYSTISTVNRCLLKQEHINTIINLNKETIIIEGNNLNSEQISIYNTQGISVTNCTEIEQINPNSIQISIVTLPNGMYIIKSSEFKGVFYKN